MSIFGGLVSDLRKNDGNAKTNNTIAFWLYFGVLGLWLEALGNILGDLIHKLDYLGRSRRQVGKLLEASWR